MERHCPRCLLPESEMDTCVNKSFGPQFVCPTPIESDPTKHINVVCGQCDKHLIIPLGKIMRGKVDPQGCQSDTCQAVVMPEVLPAVSMEAAPLPALTAAEPEPAPTEQDPNVNDQSPPAPTAEATSSGSPPAQQRSKGSRK